MSAPGYALDLARDQIAWARAAHDSMTRAASRECWDAAVQSKDMRDMYLVRAAVFALAWLLEKP